MLNKLILMYCNEEYIFNFLNQSKTRFNFEPDIDMQQSLCKVETKFTQPSDLALNKHVHLLLLRASVVLGVLCSNFTLTINFVLVDFTSYSQFAPLLCLLVLREGHRADGDKQNEVKMACNIFNFKPLNQILVTCVNFVSVLQKDLFLR